jgi:hypothetical protein
LSSFDTPTPPFASAVRAADMIIHANRWLRYWKNFFEGYSRATRVPAFPRSCFDA